jgi:hypothetical protein
MDVAHGAAPLCSGRAASLFESSSLDERSSEIRSCTPVHEPRSYAK